MSSLDTFIDPFHIRPDSLFTHVFGVGPSKGGGWDRLSSVWKEGRKGLEGRVLECPILPLHGSMSLWDRVGDGGRGRVRDVRCPGISSGDIPVTKFTEDLCVGTVLRSAPRFEMTMVADPG